MHSVICDGEVIYADGRFTKVDRDAALRALHEDLNKALADDEVERRKLSKALLPHVKAFFYAEYFDPSAHAPFYRPVRASEEGSARKFQVTVLAFGAVSGGNQSIGRPVRMSMR